MRRGSPQETLATTHSLDQNRRTSTMQTLIPNTGTGSFLGKRVQLAFVVTDLDATLKYWTEVLGVGPFVVLESSKGGRKIIHRGEETDVDYALSFAYMGDVQIEIVMQTNDAPSTYKEFTDQGKTGLHHIAYWPEDFE